MWRGLRTLSRSRGLECRPSFPRALADLGVTMPPVDLLGDEVAERAADNNVRGKMFFAGDPRHRYSRRQAHRKPAW